MKIKVMKFLLIFVWRYKRVGISSMGQWRVCIVYEGNKKIFGFNNREQAFWMRVENKSR